MKIIEINARIPVFPGFYSTEYEPDETSEVEHWSKHYKLNLNYDHFKWDYESYQNEVSENACSAIKELCPFILECEFSDIDSPREYNFRNDHVCADMKIDFSGLFKFVMNNFEDWQNHLVDMHKSRDGFISFYSHNSNDWIEKFTDPESLDNVEIYSLLEFWAILEIDSNQFYEMCTQGVSLNGALKLDREDITDLDTFEAAEVARKYLNEYVESKPFGYGEFLLSEAKKTAEMFCSDIDSELDNCQELAKEVIAWAKNEFSFDGWIEIEDQLYEV